MAFPWIVGVICICFMQGKELSGEEVTVLNNTNDWNNSIIPGNGLDEMLFEENSTQLYNITDEHTTVVPGSKSAGENVIIFTNSSGIHILSIDSSQIQIRKLDNNNTRKPYRVDYDPIKRTVLWTEHTSRIIEKSNVDNTDFHSMEYGHKIVDFAVDWIARLVFHSDFDNNRIIMSDLETLRSEHHINVKNPLRLSVDMFHSFLYWVGNYRKIQRSYSIYENVGGLKTLAVVNWDVWALLVDYLRGSIYYYNAENQLIEEMIIGTFHKRAVTRKMVMFKASAFTLQGKYLYWKEMGEIKKIVLRTNHSKEESVYDESAYIPDLTIANLEYTYGTECDRCHDVTVCWGINNGWKSLQSHMVCDGSADCYGEIDEMYCCYDNDKCGVSFLYLSCKQSENGNVLVNASLKIHDWDTHPFSKILQGTINIPSICDIWAWIKDSYGIKRRVRARNLQKYHYFRQFAGPGIFRRVRRTKSMSINGDLGYLKARSFEKFRNLLSLKIRKTNIKRIGKNVFFGLRNLLNLQISGNLQLSSVKMRDFNGLNKLRKLILVENNILQLVGRVFKRVSTITFLNISNNGIEVFGGGVLDALRALEDIDMRRNGMRLTSNLFKETRNLSRIYSDSYSFCCIKPQSVKEGDCFAPAYDVSSCDDLIQDQLLRIFLWIIGVLSLCGNIAVLIYRFGTNKKALKETFSIFASNLSLSDAIMGLYMLIIAAHDALFQGDYVWMDYEWRRSTTCKISGILAYASSESSVMFISLITIDRFLAMKYPFGGKRFTVKRAFVCSAAAWILSFAIAIIPALVYPEYFSYSGVCIALPLSNTVKPGWQYSVAIFLGFNFVTFVLITFGQILIFREIRLSAKRAKSKQLKREMAVAKMLLVVVATDCLCWLPIGIMVIMAQGGVEISRVVYAWVIVFVLPVNSAMNPFLYTIVPECRKKAVRVKRSIKMKEIVATEKRTTSSGTTDKK